jgi:hypothetical protein
MYLLGDLADWWEARRRETAAIMDGWMLDVGRTNNDFAIVAVGLAATLTHTAMFVGGGFVDVLRLGQGVRRGTVGGVAQDGLRLLSVAGPLARTFRLSLRLLPRLVGPVTETLATSQSGACAWVAAVNALRRTGVRHFATIAQMLEAAGITFSEAGQGIRSLSRLLVPLRALGANPVVLRGDTTLQELTTLLQSQARRGVAIFGIGWPNPTTQQSAGHVLVAFLEGGQLRILDRTGRVVRSLEELEAVGPGYHGMASAPGAPAYFGPAAIGPPGTLPGLGWEPEILFIPEAVPLPGLPRIGSILSQIGFEVQGVLLYTRDQAEARLRQLRQRRGVQVGPAIPVQPPTARPTGRRRDGESPF